MGSSAAITFALLGVAIVFGLLRSDHPQLAMELPQLLVNLGMFSVLTAVAGASFYGQLRQRAWRLGAVVALVVSLAWVAWFQWPDR
jgi:predicted benzoate:H+ symporter BenE